MGVDTLCSCENCELRELFFSSVERNELHSLCTQHTEVNYLPGDFIIKQGMPIEEFIYLKSGLVKLFISEENGKEQILTIARPFNFVSMLSIFSSKTYNYSVQALEQSVTCSIPMDKINQLILCNGRFARSILEKMSHVSDNIIKEMMEIRKRHLRGRIAYILLYYSKELAGSLEFELALSRKEIAEYIGMTTENVIRSLTEFRKSKIIKIFGRVIEITDIQRLEQISKFG
jgi:CRP/FNR family transcriptional regulator